MNIKDRILKFRAFALSSHTSIYNEDSMTASQLVIECNKKMVECLEVVDALSTAIDNMLGVLNLSYDENAEELTLTLQEKVANIKTQVNNSFVSVYNEDSMTAIEQAGCCARSVNECLKAINMLSDLVLEVNDLITLSYVANEQMLVIGGNEHE